jgi:hypothetical protein
VTTLTNVDEDEASGQEAPEPDPEAEAPSFVVAEEEKELVLNNFSNSINNL